MNFWDPVDPMQLSGRQFIEKIRLILEANEMGITPDEPLPPGYYRCFSCRRVRPIDKDVFAIGIEFEERFGRKPVDPVLICSICDRIMSILWPREPDEPDSDS